MYELNQNLLILWWICYDQLKCSEVLNHDELHGYCGSIIKQEEVDKLVILLDVMWEYCVKGIFLSHSHSIRKLSLVCFMMR